MRISVVAAMIGIGTIGVGAAWGSEPSCYRSAAEAVAQVGVRGVEGYRLDATRRDVFSGAVWATVKRCGHPEQPGVMVLAGLGSRMSAEFGASVARRSEVAAAPVMVMLAGTRVRLVETSENTRVEMNAVAQASGAVGDRVRVRVLPMTSAAGASDGGGWGSEERFAFGIVRGRDVLEMEAR